MKLSFSLLLVLPLASNAFVPSAFLLRRVVIGPQMYRNSNDSVLQMAGPDADAVDYDAPLDRRVAVGDIVKSGQGIGPPDHEIVVDDECYTGKDGDMDECADFDPVSPSANTRSQLKSDDRTDFDAPLYRQKEAGGVVASGKGKELEHEPVVDDECYTGKDGDFKECVDFDPL